MKNNKQKGYVLAVVLILTFVMTITVTSAFTMIMRYMFFAKNNLQELDGQVIYNDTFEEVDVDACI